MVSAQFEGVHLSLGLVVVVVVFVFSLRLSFSCWFTLEKIGVFSVSVPDWNPGAIMGRTLHCTQMSGGNSVTKYRE